MFNFTAKGLFLLLPGLLLTGYGFLKFTVFGYYPSEAVLTFATLIAGIALMWGADRFGRVKNVDKERVNEVTRMEETS